MVYVTATVEYYFLDALFQSTFCYQLANNVSAFAVAAVSSKVLFVRRCSDQSVACYVIDDLCNNVVVAAVYAQTGSVSGTGDLIAESLVALDSSSLRVSSLNHLTRLLTSCRTYQPCGG